MVYHITGVARLHCRSRDSARTAWLHHGRSLRCASRCQTHQMSVYRQTRPNQAMQLTATKPAVYAVRVCRRERMLRGMRRGLAAADCVSLDTYARAAAYRTSYNGNCGRI